MMMATQHDVYLCKKQQQQKFIGLVFSLVCLFVLDKKTCHFCCCWWWYRIDSTFLWWFFILLLVSIDWLDVLEIQTYTHIRCWSDLDLWTLSCSQSLSFELIIKTKRKNLFINIIIKILFFSWSTIPDIFCCCWFFLMDLCNMFVYDWKLFVSK